ncbi:hypothetical protein OAN96_00525 [Candidatus Gracilibacteria bacterium]|nr:hypothetical protein [Candidatus Gracilibacteria bacterium]
MTNTIKVTLPGGLDGDADKVLRESLLDRNSGIEFEKNFVQDNVTAIQSIGRSDIVVYPAFNYRTFGKDADMRAIYELSQYYELQKLGFYKTDIDVPELSGYVERPINVIPQIPKTDQVSFLFLSKIGGILAESGLDISGLSQRKKLLLLTTPDLSGAEHSVSGILKELGFNNRDIRPIHRNDSGNVVFSIITKQMHGGSDLIFQAQDKIDSLGNGYNLKIL